VRYEGDWLLLLVTHRYIVGMLMGCMHIHPRSTDDDICEDGLACNERWHCVKNQMERN